MEYLLESHCQTPEHQYKSNDITQKIISMLNAQEENSKSVRKLNWRMRMRNRREYTLNLAANYQHVTAVDMSEQMLCVLKQRAEKEKITNITYRQSLFEHLPESKQYDFVFAAMCPAICDYESLMKFERLSKNHCCLVSVAKNSSSRLRKELRMQLTDQPLKGLSPDIIYQFHLWHMHWADTPNFHSASHSVIPLEEAVERYRIYFDIFLWTTNPNITISFTHTYLRIPKVECAQMTLFIIWR